MDANYLALELRKALEQKDASDVVVQSQIKNLEKALDAQEVKNQELVAKQAVAEKAAQEAKENYENLEKKFLRMPKGSALHAEKSPELKAYEDLLRFGKEYALKHHEIKYLRTDVDSQGGFLAPTDYVSEIIKKITEYSPIRQIARVRQTARDSISIPRRDSLGFGNWVGEGALIAESDSAFGMEIIKVNKLAVSSVATIEMIQDAAFNMEAEINGDISERFAVAEGRAFVLGDSIEKPEGFLFNRFVETINSGIANGFSADALIELTGVLKQGYNPTFVLNRRVLSYIRRLKDGNGQYIWSAGLSNQPNMILGYPYLIANDMPDVGVNTRPVAFGDFGRGYNIVDGAQMNMLRDDYTLSLSGKIRYVAIRRIGGQVVLPEAIKVLQCAI